MTKTELFTVTDDVIVPDVGVNTFTVADFSTPTGIIIEPNRIDDQLLLVRRNYADTDWVPVTDDLGNVYLNAKRKEFILTMPDTYGLQGRVAGTILAYTIKD